MEGGKRRKRRRGKLIAGCVVIQEVRNVSERHISDHPSDGNTADRHNTKTFPRQPCEDMGSLWATRLSEVIPSRL